MSPLTAGMPHQNISLSVTRKAHVRVSICWALQWRPIHGSIRPHFRVRLWIQILRALATYDMCGDGFFLLGVEPLSTPGMRYYLPNCSTVAHFAGIHHVVVGVCATGILLNLLVAAA